MSGRAVRDSVTCAEEIISRLDDLRIQATTERSHFYVGAVCEDASKALRELKREVEYERQRLAAVGVLAHSRNEAQLAGMLPEYESDALAGVRLLLRNLLDAIEETP